MFVDMFGGVRGVHYPVRMGHHHAVTDSEHDLTSDSSEAIRVSADFTIKEAEERCGITRAKIMRALKADKLPGAYKANDPLVGEHWRIPEAALIAAGFNVLNGVTRIEAPPEVVDLRDTASGADSAAVAVPDAESPQDAIARALSGIDRTFSVLSEQLASQAERAGRLEGRLELRTEQRDHAVADLDAARVEIAELRRQLAAVTPAGVTARRGWFRRRRAVTSSTLQDAAADSPAS